LLRCAVVVALGTLVGCAGARAPRPEEPGPGIVVPVPLAEGHGDGALTAPVPSGVPTVSSSAAASGSAAAGPPPPSFTSDPPDPQPLRLADQYEYTLHYEDAKIRLVALRRVRFPSPVVTARRMGRYAFELWIGHELVDRVRFDFPLLAASEAPDPSRHKLYETPALTGGPYTVTVLVPAAPRARSARLVDRATRYQAKLSWPPEPTAGLEVTPMDPPSSAPDAAARAPSPAASAGSAAPAGSTASAPASPPPVTAASAMPAPPPQQPSGAPAPAAAPSSAGKTPAPTGPSRPRPPPPRELERP
jgi:hypothetical protein